MILALAPKREYLSLDPMQQNMNMSDDIPKGVIPIHHVLIMAKSVEIQILRTKEDMAVHV